MKHTALAGIILVAGIVAYYNLPRSAQDDMDDAQRNVLTAQNRVMLDQQRIAAEPPQPTARQWAWHKRFMSCVSNAIIYSSTDAVRSGRDKIFRKAPDTLSPLDWDRYALDASCGVDSVPHDLDAAKAAADLARILLPQDQQALAQAKQRLAEATARVRRQEPGS